MPGTHFWIIREQEVWVWLKEKKCHDRITVEAVIGTWKVITLSSLF